ncbi:MAG: hypothetical protein ACK5IQ_08290 [Bacteroidales bacterium]
MARRTDRSLATPRELEEINLEFGDEWSVMSESSLAGAGDEAISCNKGQIATLRSQ